MEKNKTINHNISANWFNVGLYFGVGFIIGGLAVGGAVTIVIIVVKVILICFTGLTTLNI